MKPQAGQQWMDRWLLLRPRERLVLIGGGLILTAVLVIFLFWLPLQERLLQQKQIVAERVVTLQWMQQAAVEVEQWHASQAGRIKTEQNGAGSILSLVDQTARNQGLGDALKQVEPEGTERVRLSFDKLSFDKFMAWLALLDQENDIHVQQLTIQGEGTPGYVQARMVLGRDEQR